MKPPRENLELARSVAAGCESVSDVFRALRAAGLIPETLDVSFVRERFRVCAACGGTGRDVLEGVCYSCRDGVVVDGYDLADQPATVEEAILFAADWENFVAARATVLAVVSPGARSFEWQLRVFSSPLNILGYQVEITGATVRLSCEP